MCAWAVAWIWGHGLHFIFPNHFWARCMDMMGPLPRVAHRCRAIQPPPPRSSSSQLAGHWHRRTQVARAQHANKHGDVGPPVLTCAMGVVTELAKVLPLSPASLSILQSGVETCYGGHGRKAWTMTWEPWQKRRPWQQKPRTP